VTKPLRWISAAGAALVVSLAGLTAVATASAAPRTAHQTIAQHVDNVGKAAALRALDPAAEVCEQTRLGDYVDALILSMTDEELAFLVAHVDTLLDVPTYAPLLYGSPGDPTYALTLHATQLQKAFRQVKGFWDIASDDIQLMAMHGEVLTDADIIEATNLVLDEGATPPADIRAEAEEVAAYMQAHPAFAGNPLWTLNAYAFSAVDEEPGSPFVDLPDKLVFGDGFLEAFDAFGLGDVGPRVVMGHEFGHHIQYEDNLFVTDPELPAPEATRRTELMADAFASYFGTHKRGLALNAKRVADALETGFTSGDCFVDDDNHHGTPQQRQRAYAFGSALAAAAKPKSYVLPSVTVAALFDDALPAILTPDAS
jgi:hypothetical protein